ncbi:MAG: tetratricopeptide repeat protein [Cyanobacteria bacterium P01_H01_bin.74]
MRFIFCFICIAIILISPPCQAARKYYPPGITSPDNQQPSKSPVDEDTKTKVSYPKAGTRSSQPQHATTILRATPIRKSVPRPSIAKKSKPSAISSLSTVNTLIKQRQYYEALRIIESALQKKPVNVFLTLKKALILRKQGDYENAVSLLKPLITKQQAGEKSTPQLMAAVYNGLGWTFLEKAQAAQSNGNTVAYQRGLQNAEINFQAALSSEKNYGYSKLGLAEVALLRNMLPNADSYYKEALELLGQNPLVQLTRGKLLLAENNLTQAQAVLYKLNQANEQETEVLYWLAKVASVQKNTDNAMIHLRQLLEVDPEHTAALKLLSQLYDEKAQPQPAKKALEKVVVLDPADESSVQALLADYEQQGHPEKGLLLLRTVVNAAPANTLYQSLLFERLYQNEAWDEILKRGEALLATAAFQNQGIRLPLERNNPAWQAYNRIVGIVAFALFKAQKQYFYSDAFLNKPGAVFAKWFSKRQLALLNQLPIEQNQALSNEIALNLLLIDPLQEVGRLPAYYVPQDPADWVIMLQITLLQGDHNRHKQLLEMIRETPRWAEAALPRLMRLGDIDSALDMLTILGQTTENPVDNVESNGQSVQISRDLQPLAVRLKQAQVVRQEQLHALKRLSKDASDGFLRQLVSDALQNATADAKAHRLVAKTLKRRKSLQTVAARQLKLAQRYASHAERKEANWFESLF